VSTQSHGGCYVSNPAFKITRQTKDAEVARMPKSGREPPAHYGMRTSNVMSLTALISKSLPHLLHFTKPSPWVKNAGVLHFAQLACFATCEYRRFRRVRACMAKDSHGAADIRLAKAFGWLLTISVAHPLSSHAFTMASRINVSDSGSFALLISYVA
jgi:hypothetical protein